MTMDDSQPDLSTETPVDTTFTPPSIHTETLLAGDTYSHFSPVPPRLLPPAAPTPPPTTASPAAPAGSDPPEIPLAEECALGIDEAGRGPVLGSMVYAAFYLPLPLSTPLLREAHPFDDSKQLTPAVRASLMRTICTPGSDLYTSCGWATHSLSARDIGASMLKPGSAYNLNAQAYDATVSLIRGVMDRGVNVKEIYVDTVGPPAAYQTRLQRVFPTAKVTVAKKADSLYPCVSAASVCAKVTRDVELEILYRHRAGVDATTGEEEESAGMEWGSGYPSDARCVSWLKGNMHPVFGWGPECRFSWGTAKDLLEGKNGVKVEWPDDDDGETARLTDYFGSAGDNTTGNELGTWFGTPAGLESF